MRAGRTNLPAMTPARDAGSYLWNDSATMAGPIRKSPIANFFGVTKQQMLKSDANRVRRLWKAMLKIQLWSMIRIDFLFADLQIDYAGVIEADSLSGGGQCPRGGHDDEHRCDEQPPVSYGRCGTDAWREFGHGGRYSGQGATTTATPFQLVRVLRRR